jgi:hypothetical protein
MKRALLLILGLAFPLSAFPIVGWLVEATSPFSPSASPPYRKTLDLLAVPDIVKLKADHAVSRAPYDVGLFGNSRAVEVSAEHLGLRVDGLGADGLGADGLGADGLGADRFFNFAVGGTPFRQSVALLEYLSQRKRAPALAIISVDNHELGFDGAIYWPLPFLLQGRVLAEWSVLKDTIATSTAQIKGYPIVFGYRLHFLTANFTGTPDGREFYRMDGSRDARSGQQGSEIKFSPAEVGEYYFRTIDADMARLAKVARDGTKVVIYESPLHPRLALERSRIPNRLRSHFASGCAREGISCFPAPVLDNGGPWYDCCHAPPALLGRFIAATAL